MGACSSSEKNCDPYSGLSAKDRIKKQNASAKKTKLPTPPSLPKQGASLPAAVKSNPPAPLAGAPPPPGTYTNFKKPKTTKAGKAGAGAAGGKPEKKDPT